MIKCFFIATCIVSFHFCINAEVTNNAITNAFRSDFNVHYEAWKKQCEQVQFNSSINSRLQSEHFQAIVKMGPDVLPLVAEKCVCDTNFHWIGWVWTALTRMQNDPAINPWAKDSIKTWWEGGAELAKARSIILLDKMRESQKEGRKNDLEKAQRGLRALGIFSLETLFAELEKGNDEVLPIIQGILSSELSTVDKGQAYHWWNKNRQKYTLPLRRCAEQ